MRINNNSESILLFITGMQGDVRDTPGRVSIKFLSPHAGRFAHSEIVIPDSVILQFNLASTLHEIQQRPYIQGTRIFHAQLSYVRPT